MTSARDLAVFHAHGGRVAAARAAFGGDDWIDLSTGVAPWAWPVGERDLALDRLPEPDGIKGLEAAAAAAFGCDPPCVVAVPGTDMALRMLALVLPALRPVVVQPGYAGHAAAWPQARRIDGIVDSTDADLIVLASPANPDGRTVDIATLHNHARHTTLVLDQAYADPAPVPTPRADERLVVLRSFGKFYGLPGLRLGFVIARPDIVAPLRRLLGDWPVSGAAVAIGTAAYRDTAWRAAQSVRIAAAGIALDAVLAHARIDVVGKAALFRYVAHGDAARLFRQLAGHAILTRPFADRSDRLRIGLPGDGAACARLAAALESLR